MTTNQEALTAEELLHIALTAVGRADHAAAMRNLKQCIAISPRYAAAHYMLGVVYAQVGLTGQAIDRMLHALHEDPELEMARFQLGLLLLTNGRANETVEVLEPLQNLEQEHPLRFFAAGLIHVTKDDFDAACDCIREGIRRNSVNLPLNNDMSMLVESIETKKMQLLQKETPNKKESVDGHIGIAAYANGKSS
jgi:tetratricopeptide (TPR) repeat protein